MNVRRLGAFVCPLIIAAVIPVLVRPGRTETVYQWTDEQGTLHFSDQPPGGRKVEERHLPPPEPAQKGESVEPSSAGALPAPAPQDPARVLIERQQAERTGPSALHVSGVVRNVGGRAATQLRVRVSAPDPVQGNPCLEQEVPINVDHLEAGERKTFELELDHPCLHGEATVQLQVRWDEL